MTLKDAVISTLKPKKAAPRQEGAPCRRSPCPDHRA